MTNRYLAALVVPLAMCLNACSSDDKTEFDKTIEWTQCENLECATLEVPMDYQSPNGEQISLSLIRLKAGSDTPLGSLLFNPGGPGGSGVAVVKELTNVDALPEAILENYHIVGFDPRGIGGSTPVDCSEFDLEDANDYPLDNSAVIDLHEFYTEFAALCSEKYGNYVQQLGSLNVVRDMDEIRQATGDAKLNFIGYSYGTRLAALYLQEFPDTSGRIVLDASVSPNSSLLTLLKESLPVAQSNLENLLSVCTETDPTCDVNTLVARLNDRVLELISDESGEDEIDLLGELVIASTEQPEFGELAAESLIEYINTFDASVLETFVQAFLLSEEEDTEEEEIDDEDNATSGIAILCADDSTRYDSASLINNLNEFNQISDLFAELSLSDLAMCSGWPAAVEPLPIIAVDNAPVSLIIGGTSDAQTPLSWSQDMAQQIGGVFIRSEHPGHTSVFNDTSACVNDLVETFLIDGITPAVNTCSE